MADNIIDLLTACFWDLRSQCESQVRTLSAAQRLLDDFRRADGRADREAVVRNVRGNVKDLATAHAAMEEVIAEVRRQIDALPAGVIAKTDDEVTAEDMPLLPCRSAIRKRRK